MQIDFIHQVINLFAMNLAANHIYINTAVQNKADAVFCVTRQLFVQKRLLAKVFAMPVLPKEEQRHKNNHNRYFRSAIADGS